MEQLFTTQMIISYAILLVLGYLFYITFRKGKNIIVPKNLESIRWDHLGVSEPFTEFDPEFNLVTFYRPTFKDKPIMNVDFKTFGEVMRFNGDYAYLEDYKLDLVNMKLLNR